jgi:hypothetical protein
MVYLFRACDSPAKDFIRFSSVFVPFRLFMGPPFAFYFDAEYTFEQERNQVFQKGESLFF